MSAIISNVRLAAAHEGVAEIVVSLTYDNGGRSEVALGHVAGARLMESCGASQVEDLIGRGWEHVRDALTCAYNRD